METEKSVTEETGLSRRDFGRRMATLAAASIAVPSVLAAPAALAAEPPQKPAAPAKLQAGVKQGPAALPPVEQAEANAKYDAMVARYGSRLTDEQKRQAREELEFMQRGLEPLRAFPLENGDEPATMFGPLPSGAGWESEQ